MSSDVSICVQNDFTIFKCGPKQETTTQHTKCDSLASKLLLNARKVMQLWAVEQIGIHVESMILASFSSDSKTVATTQ